MPNNTLEDAIKEAYVCSPSNEVPLETLEFSHPAVTNPIYLVRNSEDMNLTLENNETKLFRACGFRMSLPAAGENGIQEISLGIDNVNGEVTDFVNAVIGSNVEVKVTYRPYLASDLTKPQMDPPLVLFLSDITINESEAVGKASFADIVNKKFPTQYYTRARFPSLAN